MCKEFCHLHNHTEYSLLDGANRISEIVKRSAKLEMSALAITDHGVMFGAMEFYLECQKKGVKPILGVEAYVAPAGIHKKSGRDENHNYHLLLLAKDLEGYRNLCKLSSIAALQGFYGRPRVDHDLLRQYSKGVISTTTCLGSEVNQALLRGEYEKALETAAMYRDIFGKENYFVELQDHGLAEQRKVMSDLIRISKELDLKLIATNDAHYLCKEDATPHDVLLCIGTNSQLDQEKRLRFETQEFYIKTQQEMAELFKDYPEALTNTALVADMCNVELGQQRAAMPVPELPSGLDSPSYLRQLCEESISERCKDADEKTLERLNYELEVIGKTGYEDYFLLVREFAKYTRDQGIYFGVRGSAAGSLVSYLVGITDVNPLEYDLTFERFLNPERISMPDIDMDFEDARRDEIIKYVTEKYGSDHVAQIVTFGTLGAKAAIKDAGRVMGYTPIETDKLCKAIPNLPGWTIDRTLEEVSEFRDMVQNDHRNKVLVDTARTIEGTARHCGVHAAGVVISRDPLVDYVPLYRGNDGQAITAYEMGILEKIGLLKMDFLGLSNLTVLARTVENIRQTKGKDIVVRDIPFEDEKTYQMLERGETTGVFQLEGGGMTRYLVQLKPNSVRELAAMVALYRPGPLDHIPRFIDTKFGRRKAQYEDERMIPILEETYGVIVYQDQVLKLVQALAGFSLGKADILRRAMGKKDAQAMAEMKVEFMEGTAKNGIAAESAEKIWEMLLPFAGYAFNKAHAVCYAILAYQTAYLRANYPIEYMAALLAVYRDKEDRVVAFIEACRKMKIQVVSPDINVSQVDFAIQGKTIRFGLAAIKGVGKGLTEEIIAEREANGPFTHLYEFCERTKPFGINRGTVEALIKSGAFDSIDNNRNKHLNVVDGALNFAERAVRERLAGQDSLFGEDDPSGSMSYPVLPDADKPAKSERLSMEKEVMGIYVSDHPLRGYERILSNLSSHPCGAVEELEDGTQVRLSGVISAFRKTVTKKGDTMAHITVEDFSGQANFIVFATTLAKYADHIGKDKLVVATGRMMVKELMGGSEKRVEVRLEKIEPIDQTLDIELEPSNSLGVVRLILDKAGTASAAELPKIIAKHPGSYDLCIEVPSSNLPPIFTRTYVNPSKALIDDVKSILPNAFIEAPELEEDTTSIPEIGGTEVPVGAFD